MVRLRGRCRSLDEALNDRLRVVNNFVRLHLVLKRVAQLVCDGHLRGLGGCSALSCLELSCLVLRQQLLQLGDLVLVLLQQRVLWVLVHRGLVLDVLGAACIS